MIELIPKPIRKMARRYIERRGFMPVSQGPADMHTAMQRRALPRIATVIDVGASDGRWSREMMRHYPAANYLLIEAQARTHGEALRQFHATHANVSYELCAAGNQNGQIHFDASDPLGGQALPEAYSTNDIVVPMETVDALVSNRGLSGPFLLKLDTHGFEVPIFEGARETLPQCAMLIVEAYNFTVCAGSLRFYELCPYLDARGFRCVDIFDLLVRPHDQALWQMDMVFLPASDPVFGYGSFR
jgi:FkbM family methyltransferase